MAAAPGSFLAAVMLLVSSGLHRSSASLPLCPESCSCQGAPLLNCSSSGLSSVPQHIPDSVTELDLSYNLLDSVTLGRRYPDLRNVWLGNNSIAHLSLCVQRNNGGRFVQDRRLKRGLRPWRGRGCVSWAPTLQLLSAERNQLEQLPQGLEGSESLQVLQLSFNRISTVRPGELNHLQQLKELHLQHNLITSLHPQMFQDLVQLRVLDLSFNMLTSLHPLTYLSLRNVGADVMLVGNRWRCDCSIRTLRRRMAYDSSSRGLQAWSMVCASPSSLSGRDLLQLEEDELICFSPENGPELHRDVTVYKGSEIMLSCATQDSTWWTPSGPAPESQPEAGLVINDIAETDTGLYVCVSEEQKVVSVFNLQISKIGGATRKTRSLPRIPQGTPNRIGQDRNQRTTQSHLALAVCLSVFITFLVAFILGVLARPCIDVLWRRVTKKKRSSATISVSSVEQRQYENEGFCDGEEPAHIGIHRERRVTFSTVDFREDSNVKYYDTVAGGNQGINSDAMIAFEAAEAKRDAGGDSGSENSLRQNSPDGRDLSDAGRTHNLEFEHIPDPDELVKRSLSSCSDSSRSDKVFNEDQVIRGDHSTPKTPQLVEDSVQQRDDSSIEVPQISTEGTSELAGFSSEPFADWSPYTNNTNPTDLWQENEEPFEFSDSVRSASARSSSVLGSFNDSQLTVAATSDKQKTGDTSSSSSYVSEDEPTQYIVNSDQEDTDIVRNQVKPEVFNVASFEQQIQGVDPIRPSVGFNQVDTQRPAVRQGDLFSSHSSDSDGEDYGVKKGHVPSLAVTSHHKSLDTRSLSPPAAYSASSSSESEAEITNLKVEHNTGRENKGIKINEPEMLSTDPNLQCIPQIKRRVDINAPVPASDSSSSEDSVDEMTKHAQKQEQVEIDMARLQSKEYQSVSHNALKPQWPALDLDHATPIKKHLDVKAPSPPTDSSSSSDSEGETTSHMKNQEQGQINMDKVSQSISHDQQTQWPVLDLEGTTRIKRRLGIKAPLPASDSSSSSNSEDETTIHIKKQEQGETYVARLPVKISQNVSRDSQQQWPVLDLEDTMRIKRRLDIKAPSPASDSSSSNSGDETTMHTERPGKVDIAGLPFQESQTEGHDPDTRWPVLELEDTTRIKRHPDIKAQSPASDSSTCSDSELTLHTERPGQVDFGGLPFQESQTGSHDQDTRWPALDLEDTRRIKRRLDIKAPSPPNDSCSSSDSEHETTNYMMKQEQLQMNMDKVCQNISHDPQPLWSVLDLEETMRVKRRLDIKAPSPATDSSSGSDSEDETTGHTERPGKVNIAGLPFQESQTGSNDPDMRWPVLDLEHIPRIKRHLDIKAPSPACDSSSSSDSEDETTHHIKQQKQGEMSMARHPIEVSPTASYDPQTQWPALDLEHIPHIKRHLDIKAPSPPPDSSSSSGSEDETLQQTKIERPGVMGITGLPHQVSQTLSHDPHTRWPSIDLEHIPRIKSRLDIQAPSPPPDSLLSDSDTNHTVEGKSRAAIKIAPLHSSSSSDEQEEGVEVDPDSRWPRLDLSRALHVKRRLDVKARSPPPESSSSSVHEGGTTNLPVKVETKLPKLSSGVSYNRRLDFKAPALQPDPVLSSVSPDARQSELNSSESDSDDEYRDHARKGLGVSAISKATEKEFTRLQKTPVINISHSPKTDIKLEKYTAITKEVGDKTSDNISTTPEINPELQSRWATMNLGVSRFRKRLEITSHTHEPPNLPSTPPPDSPSSSSSESGTGSKSSTARRKRREVGVQGVMHKESSLTPENNPVNVGDNSGNSIEVTESLRKDHSLPTTEEKSYPDTKLTGTPHFRRYLDFKVQEKALAPPPPLDQPQSQTEMQRKARVELKSQASKVGEESDSHLGLTNIPHIRKTLDIRAPLQRESSSSSNSEDETIDHCVPDLSLGVPRVKRRLNVKAPLPEPGNSASSCSESENQVTGYNQSRHATNVSGMTDDDSLITYKRVIMKASSLPSNSFSPSGKGQTTEHTKPRLGDINASPAPKTVPRMTFDDIVKKRLKQARSTTNVDLPPEIRWTGVGRQLSDLPIPNPRRNLGVGLLSPPAEPELPPPDSSNSSSSESDDNIKQDKEKTEVPLMHKHTSLGANSVSFASSGAFDKFDNPPSSTNDNLRSVSEARNEKKGLSALKALSSERRKWDTVDENLDKGASPRFDDHGLKGDTSFNYRSLEKDTQPPAKQPPTQLHQRRATDLLYGIPHYRRHDTGSLQPPQGPPPPIPATPPPYEAVGLTWRSAQSSTKQGLEGTRNTEESDLSPLTSRKLAVYFDSSNANISEV